MFDWTINSWIIVLVGFLASVSCSILGIFLVLRKLSLVADAISHAVLPGIAIAFLMSGDRDPILMLIGAAAFGMLATTLIEWVHRSGKVQTDAAIGVVFKTLFAIGVILISMKAGMVDLDQDCVLYGEIAYSPWDYLLIGDNSYGPRPLWVLGTAATINCIFIALFFKELKLSAFDPALATALGFSATLLHYLFMGLVSLTTVASFESVGAILVIAMFVVPASTAYLMTDRLSSMVWWVIIISAFISVGGYGIASAMNASIAGSMTTTAGVLFVIVFIFAPRRGLMSIWKDRLALKLQIATEDRLAYAFRSIERSSNSLFQPEESDWMLTWMKWKGLIKMLDGDWGMTDKGLSIARDIIRRHRSWEGYLYHELNVPADHLHRSADDVEHFLDNDITDVHEVISSDRTHPHDGTIPQ